MGTISVVVKDSGAGNAPMANVFVVLYDVANNTSTQVQTNASGQVVFTTLPAGSYRVYNTGIDTTGQNPPTECGFPDSYTGTTTPRRLDFVLAAATTTIANFFYDTPVPWSTLNGSNPPSVAITTTGVTGRGVNLANGAISTLPNIVNNGIGYSLADNMLYGSGVTSRSSVDGSVTLFPPHSYAVFLNIGDCDLDSYYYGTSNQTTNFLCVDVNPYRTTYLRSVNPYRGFQEIFTSPYFFTVTAAAVGAGGADFSYVESVQGLVQGTAGIRTMWILSLTTPTAYNVPIIGTPLSVVSGATFSDTKNFYTPTGTQILKYAMTPTVAIGTVLSASSISTTGDGTRAQSAPVFFATANVVKAVDTKRAFTGDVLTYTVTLANTGVTTGTNTIFQDTLPTGLSFVTDSITVDGVAQTGVTLDSVPIGIIPIGQVFTITFKATLDSNTIPVYTNTGNATTSFFDNATEQDFTTTFSSNAVSTIFAAPSVNTTKSVNRSFTTLGEVLDYTIRINNTSTDTVLSTILTDTTPSGTTFVSNSIKVDGVTAPNGSTLFPTGFSIGTIPAGKTTTVTFKVTVVSVPNNFEIDNSGLVDYKDFGATAVKSTTTNIVTTTIVSASLSGITKSVDKAFAKVGDTLTYTIILPNSGNTTALNVVLKDTIPNNTAFVANSVSINGVTQSGAVVAPPTGLSVGTIPNGSVVTITFQVTVSTIPSPNPIPNNTTTTYSYTVDPSLGTTGTGSANSNTVTTQVNTALVGTTKAVSAANVFVGDTVTYTMVLRNTGNTTANSVLLTDTIPNGGTFVTDSVTVNGTTQTGINPQTNGVVVPTLPVGGVATVTFKVILDTIPVPNPTPNTAVTSYSYLLDSSTPTNQSEVGSSNTVTTFVNPNSNPLKVVDKTSATVGDTLTYFIQWANVTNTTETDVIFVDTLPNGVTFVPNSVTINGVSQPGFTITPPNGINTGTLPLDGTVSITYKVIINTIPVPNPIPNTASVTNTGGSGTQTQESNQVSTQVNFAEITQAPKTVDKAFNTVGETMTYTIVLFNNGNTSANNVVVLDTIPNGTTFVVNSVSVNGVNQPGAVVAPTTGLTLSCIPAGTAATITFQVLVQSIPTPNPTPNTASASFSYIVDNVTGQTKAGNVNTNTVTTTIVDATIVSTKTVSKSFAQVGDTLTYTIALVATGNTTANNAVLIDSLPSTLTYVPGTFAINGSIVAGANPAPPGQSIGSLTIPATYTITFNAVVNTLPTTNPIQNEAQTNYAYTVEPTLANSRTRGSITNIANTTVSQASLGGITKSVDKLFADCGETITYTVVIPNSGNVAATSVVFRDTIPSGTVLVADSVTVNGTTQTGASPQTGINIGTIAAGDVTTVVFKVTVQC